MKHFIVLIFLMLLFINGLSAQIKPPKLILSIVIDELDNDQLLLLQSSFSDKGINCISREGFRFMSVTSHDWAGYPGTRMTSLYTGMTVSEHGIVGEQWYNYSKEQFEGKISFNNQNSFKEAQNLNMSRTLGDYLKSFYGSKAGVAAISINSPWMVHTSGYNPDYFFTLNPETGQFYEVLNGTEDSWVSEFNSRYSTVNYLSRQWGPLNDITSYVEFRYLDEKNRPNFRNFLYDMNDGGTYRKIAASPYGNSLLRDFTVAFLVNSKFGQDDIPDLLSVCFTSRPFTESGNSIIPAEKEDMLLRIDTEIASLIEFFDIEFGRKNYLIMLTSGVSPPIDNSSFALQGSSTGFFDGNKSMALLNLYLMAIHGQKKWVLGFNDGMIFLNRNLIEKERLSLKNMQDSVALFMHEYSGVAKALPLNDYMLYNHCDEIISKNLFFKRTGDILITLHPGWQTTVTESGSRQNGISGFQTIPFIFFGWNTEKGAWFENIDLTNLMPLLMKTIGLGHPKSFQSENVPVFKE